MPTATKAMTVATASGLVLATAYTVGLGGSGWVWFAWLVLGLATLGLVTAVGH
ncbi:MULTISPECIES: hypothetical protein [unclassified Streptomyces]|uniref:hypothetical protein n=1 Tax=unclassified Streptomyces TaxID=2593676 RepID=UPI0022B6F2C8|nr:MULTISPECIES: hypothetical protein [unclassified Streptomyces]MCZ7412987.1 hypothetical protein [Streptomyces sp. WMMC897]MCZ7434704.1 hypothetical protein [Streptomyces sp. WMMC1477]